MVAQTLELIRENGEGMVLPAHDPSIVDLLVDNKKDVFDSNLDINSAEAVLAARLVMNTVHGVYTTSEGTNEGAHTKERNENYQRAMRSMVAATEQLSEADRIFEKFMEEYSPQTHAYFQQYLNDRVTDTQNAIAEEQAKLDEIDKQAAVLDQDVARAEETNNDIKHTEGIITENPELRHFLGDQLSEQQQEFMQLCEKYGIDPKGINREEAIEKLKELQERLGQDREIVEQRLESLKQQFEKFEGLQDYVLNTPAEQITRERLEELGLTQDDIEHLAQTMPDLQKQTELEADMNYLDTAYNAVTDFLNYFVQTPEEEITPEDLINKNVEKVIEVGSKYSAAAEDGRGIYTPFSSRIDFAWAAKQPDNMTPIDQPQMSVAPKQEANMSTWDKSLTEKLAPQSPALAPPSI